MAVAALLGIGLLGYYAFQGARYYDVRGVPYVAPEGKENLLLVEIDSIIAKLAGPKPDARRSAAELADQGLRLEELESQFQPRSANDLIKILSTTARETNLGLLSISTGVPTFELVGETEYQIQPVSISVKGQVGEISAFLRSIHQKIPVASIPGFETGGLEGVPSARISILFHFRAQESDK